MKRILLAAIVPLLLFARTVQATCTGQCVQEAVVNHSDTTCSTTSVAFGSITVGAEAAPLLVVDVVGSTWNGSLTPLPTGVTDNCGGSWSNVFVTGTSAQVHTAMYYSQNHPSGACVVTVAYNAGSPSTNCLQIQILREVSGIKASGALDKSDVTGLYSGTGTTWQSGTTATLSQANEFVETFASFINSNSNSFTVGAPFTLAQNANNNVGNPNFAGLWTAYETVSSTTGVQSTFTTTQASSFGANAGNRTNIVTFENADVATPTATATATATSTATATATSTATATATPAGSCTPNAGVYLINPDTTPVNKIMNGTASGTTGKANFTVVGATSDNRLMDSYSGTASSTTSKPNHVVWFVDNAGKVCNGTPSASLTAHPQKVFRVCTSAHLVAPCAAGESATSANYTSSVNIIDANGFVDDTF